MTFKTTVDKLLGAGYGIQVHGFINVEGGYAAVATKHFTSCDCMMGDSGPFEVECSECGRSSENYVSISSGDGDGAFVVATIHKPGNPEAIVGAFALFDYRFEAVQRARSALEAKSVPTFPMDLALQFADAKPVDLGTLKNTGQVYFSEAAAAINGRDPIVDVTGLEGQGVRVVAFAESVANDVEGAKRRLRETQGLGEGLDNAILRSRAEGQALMEMKGFSGEYEFPSWVPRILMALSDEIAEYLSLDDQIVVDNWGLENVKFSGTVVTSNREPQHEYTIWVNMWLAQEKDRAAPEVLPDEETKRLLFNMTTWLYQGASNGDQDCVNALDRITYQPTGVELASLYRRRGLYEEADKVLAGIVDNVPGLGGASKSGMTSSKTTGSSGLSKAHQGGLGVGQPQNEGLAETPNSGAVAKFCSSCGTAFASETAKFCSSCGSPR